MNINLILQRLKKMLNVEFWMLNTKYFVSLYPNLTFSI